MRILGLEVVRTGGTRLRISGALNHLIQRGIHVNCVIDVGVGYGTPDLYRLFSSCRIILIDPVEELKPVFEKICSKYDAKYVIAAASDRNGSEEFHIRKDVEASTMFNEVGTVDEVKTEVRTRRLDEIVEETNSTPPFLLKLDVQGAELKVLEGAPRTLADSEAVIIETTTLPSLIGAPDVYDVMSFMKKHDFVLYDLFGMNYRPSDSSLAQLDMVFVKESSKFRANRHYRLE